MGAFLREARNFIDGRFCASGGAEILENRFPCTGEVFGVVHSATQGEVDEAVAAARRALDGPWGRMDVPARISLLRKVSEGIRARFDEFLNAEIMDTGKPVSIAKHIDIPRGGANFDMFADQIAAMGTESFMTGTPDGAGALNYALRVPRGVIAVICPWNLPLLLMTWKVAPALACGNAVVVKPSEMTPSTATLLGEVMNAAGIPQGVYNVVHGTGSTTGQYLAEHPEVDGITFTGATRTGEAIMRAAAEGVRPVSLELGGKNAGIVFADADINQALEGLARACFANTGQVCLGTERLYVHRSIFEPVVNGLAQKARAYRMGAPFLEETTMGPLISQAHREKVLGYYERARAEGAVEVSGGNVPSIAGFEGGYWVEPTIWTGLSAGSPVLTEEIFGPCAHVTPFDDEEEAIAMANDSPYGLATTVWTQDISRGHRVAAKIEAGVAWVNCWFLRDLRTPFGGCKKSGIGREGGSHSFEFYTELRNVCVKL